MRTSLRLMSSAVATVLLAAAGAGAQEPASARGIGVVTALQGQATVSRAALPQPAPLRFKENVFFRDQIATKERSTLRLLLGGKGVLTIREQSQVTLDEQVAGPARQSVINVTAGKVGAAIARSLMRPGETVEIRTPNASAAVRGTVLIAEYIPPKQSAAAPERVLLASVEAWPILAQAGGAGQSNFFVLSGQVTVSVAGQPPVTLGAMQSVSVAATPAGVTVGAVQAMTPEQAAQASQGLQAGKAPAGAGEAGRGAQAQAQIAAALATAIVEASQAGQPTVASPGGANTADSAPSESSDSTTGQATETPITPDVSTPTTENTPPAGSLVEISETAVGLAAGVPLADIADGTVNAVAPMEISGTGTVARTTPLLTLRGKTVTHSGRLVGLAAGAAVAGAAADFQTALLTLDGNSLTNTDAELLRLRGGSSVTTYGPLLGLKTGATATVAGLVDAAEDSWIELRLAEGVSVPSGTTLKTDQPLLRLTDGDSLLDAEGDLLPVLKTAGSLLEVSGGKVELSGLGQVLQAVDSKVHLGGSVVRIGGSTATLTSTATVPMILVENQPLTVAGSLLDLRDGATVTASGIVLDAKESDVIVTGPLFAIRGASRLDLSGGPLVRLRGGTLTGTGGFGDSDEVGNQITATGAMLEATDATITFSRTTATDIPAAGASTEVLAIDMPAGAYQVSLTNTSYTDTTEDEVGMLPSGTATFRGRLLLGTDSTLDLGGKLFQIDKATDKVTTMETEPLIRLEGTEVTTGRPAIRVSKGELTTNGPLLLAKVSPAGNTSEITSASGYSILAVEAGGKLSGTAGTNLLTLTDTTVEAGGYVADVQGASSTLSLAGPLASVAGGSVTADNGFLRLWNGGSLTSTGTAVLVSNSNADFTGGDGANTSGSFLWMGSGPGQTGTTLDLRGGLLSDTSSTLETTDGDFLAVRDGATLTTASTSAALVTLTGSTVKAPMTLFRFGPDAAGSVSTGSGELATVSLSGPLVDATNTQFSTTGGGFLGVRNKSSFTGTGTEPLIALKKAGTSWSTVKTPAGHFLLLEGSTGVTPPTLTLSGPLLSSVGADITTGDAAKNASGFLRVAGSAELTGKGSGALVQLTEGTSVTAAGEFLAILTSQTGTNSLVSLAGPLAGLDAATFTSKTAGPTCCSFVMLDNSGKLTGTGTAPLIKVENSSEVTTGGPFLKLAGSSRLELAGPLLHATASDLASDGTAFVHVSGSEVTASGADEPFINLTNSGITLKDPAAVVRLDGGGTLSVPGPLLKASNTTFTFTTKSPFLKMTGSSVSGASLTAGSPLIDLSTSTFNLSSSQPLITLEQKSILKNTGGGPLVRVLGGSLTASTLLATDGVGNTLDLRGTLLDAQDTSVTLGSMIERSSTTTDTKTYKLVSSKPFVKLVNADLTLTGADKPLVDPDYFGSTFEGLSLNASNTTSTAKTIELQGPVLRLAGVTLKSSQIQTQLENITLDTPDSIVKVESGTSATSGPLLDSTKGSLSAGENLLELKAGAVLNTDTHNDPLFTVKGATADADGVGSDEVLSTTGATIQAEGTTAAPVTVTMSGKGNLFTLDKALLKASAPILSLLNAKLTVEGNSSKPNIGAIDVNQSAVSTLTSFSKLFSLDNSTLQVNNGPLLSVTGGTQMTVDGDFAYLTNGSKVTVQNGPLIYVGGASPKGVASSLTINGSLIKFGSGSNSVIIRNDIPVTRTVTVYSSPDFFQVPVSESVANSSVSLPTSGTIQGMGGTFTVTDSSKATGSGKGVAIQVTDGAKMKVNIAY